MNAKTGLLTVLFLLLGSFSALGQSDFIWQWNSDGGDGRNDRINASMELDNGDIVSAGFTNMDGNSGVGDACILKHSSDGELLWNYTYELDNVQLFSDFDTTYDGGFILVGEDDMQGWIVKIDSDGEILWSNHYSDGYASYLNKVIESTDHSIYISGTLYYGATNTRMWSIKLDENGNEIWNRTFVPEGLQSAGNGIVETSEGDFVMAGISAEGSVNPRPYLVKIDSQGDTLWTEEYLDSDILMSWTHSLDITAEGNLILGTCYVPQTLLPRTGLRLLKTDSEGTVLIDRLYYNTIFDNYLWQATEMDDDGFMLIGHTTVEESDDLITKTYLIRTDATGDILSSRVFGSAGQVVIPQCGFKTSNGEIVYAGYQQPSALASSDFMINRIYDLTMPAIVFDNQSIDFGSVDVGEDGYEGLMISNVSGVDITIDSITLEPPYSHSFDLPLTLSSGESVNEHLTFHPTESGTYSDTLIVHIADSDLLYSIPIIGVGHSTSDVENIQELPNTFELGNAYPNPFNSEMSVSIGIPNGKKATLNIFNVNGQLVDKIELVGSGIPSKFNWHPSELSSGVYFLMLRLENSQKSLMQKVMYLQ